MSTESDYFGSRAEDYSGQPARSNLQTVSDSGRLEGRQQTPYAGSAPLERYPTSHLEPIDDPRGAHSRTNTAPTTISRFQTANDDERVPDRDPTHAEDLNRQRIERKQEQKVPVDDEYYSLNPWYGQQPDKPLFGLSNPFPRTVRPGMRRPRRTLKESEFRATGQQTSAAEREGIQTGDAAQVRQPQSRGTGVDRLENPSTFQDVERSQQPPLPRTETGGRHQQRRQASSGTNTVIPGRSHDHQIGDRGIDEHNLQIPESRPHPHTFGLQQGLPPLQEVQSHKSADTAQTTGTQGMMDKSYTQMEKDEIQERERQDRQDFYNTYRNPLARFRAKHPQALAEWLSTFVYIFMGITGSLSILTSNSENGGYATQCSAWGLAVMTAIYVGGGVSGAHLNPWISVSLWFYRGFPKRMCLTFIVAQMLGGFCAGALAYLIYREAILNMDPGLDPNTTGKAFFTAPQPFVSPTTAFFNDYVSMCIWIIVVFALGDDQNAPPGAGLNALIIGLFTYLLSISMGYQTGLGVNPARDLGPRLVALWAGYGTEIFTTGWWAYGPIGAGLAGSLTGGFIYDAFVFVGGESPVNYRWPHPTEVKWFAKVKKDQAKDKLSDSLV